MGIKVVSGVSLGKNSIAFSTKEVEAPTTVKVKLDDNSSGKVVVWGEDNLYPQKLLEAIRKNGAAGGGLKILKSTHYGEGFQLYKNKVEEGKRTKEIIDFASNPDIKAFFKRSKMGRFWTETIADLETLSIGFPEFILSNDYQKITRVRRQKSAWCRFEEMHEKRKLIENVFIRADWTEEEIDDEFTEKVDVIDSYWTADEIKEYCKKNKIHKFIMPVFYPMMDEAYYPITDWHSSYRNGWMEVANSVPKLKDQIFKQQIHLKFIIYVSEEYFEHHYGDDWKETFDPKKREKLRKELKDAIHEHLAGNEAGGRSLTSPVFKDKSGEWVKGIEVEAIPNTLKDGDYLPDAAAANTEILFPMGVDPTLIGAGIPGGKLGAGSGSDKREAYTILSALFKTKRETTLEIWNLIRDYNGWDDTLEGSFPNTVLTTLDKNPTGKETKI